MVVATSWTVEVVRIPEYVIPGKRLGRHVRHDSRNRLFPHQRKNRALTSQIWPRNIPILDQGELGSCTGNEQVGALGTGPLFAALPPTYALASVLNEALAVKFYSAAEILDGGKGLPTEDEGSTGPSAAQVAKTMGYISGYTHGFSLADMLDALEDGPVGMGSNWYDSMDSPDSTGLVAISSNASVRGGHEYLARGKDVTKQIVVFDNSWGLGFGVKGSFSMGYGTIERLLSEQGDVTISLPLSVPAPTPVPIPVTPVPVPPTPVPGPDNADLALYRNTLAWSHEHHVGGNATTAQDLRAWYEAKGLS